MPAERGRFANRKAIITGGASGLGRACAARIAAEGGAVVIWDNSPEKLDQDGPPVEAAGVLKVDISDPAAVADAAEKTRKLLGKVDILVNSAGITGPTTPVSDFPVDAWRRVIDINLNGTFYCCRAVVPMMVAHGYGRVVNVSSVAGKEGNPNASAYSASKAGVIGLTKSLGKELATQGVIVNCITPATFESPILEQLPQSQIDYMRSRIPMGRLGEVPEVAALVCWLVSEECTFSTAATFDISGGRTTY